MMIEAGIMEGLAIGGVIGVVVFALVLHVCSKGKDE